MDKLAERIQTQRVEHDETKWEQVSLRPSEIDTVVTALRLLAAVKAACRDQGRCG